MKAAATSPVSYFILACRKIRPEFECERDWFMEFGSYDRNEVAEVRAEVLDSGEGYRTRIVECADSSAEVVRAMEALNAGY